MYRLGKERVGVAYYGADIEVVLPVFYRHLKIVAPRVQVSHYGFASPVTVSVHHISGITLGQQLWVIPFVFGPFARPGPNAHQASMPLAKSIEHMFYFI